MGKLRYNVDNWIENGDSWRIRGWAYMDDQHECVIRLLDARKMPLPAMISRTERKDVDQETGADGSLPAGFVIDISKEAAGKKKVWLEITADGRTYLRCYRIPYSEAQREQNKKPAGPLMEKLMGITIRGRSLGYLIRHGRRRGILLLGIGEDSQTVKLHLIHKIHQDLVILLRLPRKSGDKGGTQNDTRNPFPKHLHHGDQILARCFSAHPSEDTV